MTAFTLADLAARLGGRAQGDATVRLSGVAPLAEAGPEHLSFLANARYLPQARITRAGAVLVGRGVELPGRTLLVVPDAYLALAAALELFHPPAAPQPGVAPGAFVAADSIVARSATVMQGAVVGAGSIVGESSVLMPHVVLGARVRVGEGTTLHPGVTVYEDCVLGNRIIVHAGAVIGSDGFGFARDAATGRYRKIPQVGNVVVEDDVEIGAGVTVDRATFGSTRIGRGCKIDNLVQIGHNVTIGEDSILVAQSGISGSTRIGRGVTFAGQSGAVGHITIGDGAVIGAKSAVTRDVPPRAFVIGHPAMEARAWKRSMAVFSRLPEMRRLLSRLAGATDPDKEE